MIEVGMMVEIVGTTERPCLTHRGHIGKVLRPCSVHEGNWDIEGAEILPTLCGVSYHPSVLKPIIPPTDDISLTRLKPITFDDCAWQPEVEIEA